MTAVDLQAWSAGLAELHRRIARRFGRAEPRERVLAYMQGPLAGLERKNCWTLAEFAGQVSPDGMQRLVRTADWDTDAVRDDLPATTWRITVVPVLGEEPAAEVARTREVRREADRLRDDAVSRSREAARRLHEQGLPHRDIGVLLGVSHQAVSKLLAG